MLSNTEKRFRKMHFLNWKTPSLKIPHGLLGAVATTSGLFLILHSITGYLYIFYYNLPVLTYVVSAIMNAIGGLKLLHLCPVETKGIFKRCALLQICLSLYVLRFTPQFTKVLSYFDQVTKFPMDPPSNFDVIKIFSVLIATAFVKILDIVLAIATLFCTLSFHHLAYEKLIESNVAIAVAISIGTFGIMLLSTYPMHLAILGQEWWECVQTNYPKQNVGFVGYIYIPATVTFGLILFGATLYQRKILKEIEFSLLAAVTILVCLVTTVLSQEVHIPYVSTQRIYLPCVEPEEGSLGSDIMIALDFSLYARSILTRLFNIEFV